MIREVDFQLYEDKTQIKTFKFTNSDGSIYSFGTSTVRFDLFLDGPGQPPEQIIGDIELSTGKVFITFTGAVVDTLGEYEYVMMEVKADLSEVPLLRGNVVIVVYTPFSQKLDAFIEAESPGNLAMSENFKNNKIFYWRVFLQSAFNISDADLNDETKWPLKVNLLIAKLVVYDAIMLAATGNFIAFLGGSYTSSSTSTATSGTGGSIKSIETGPTRVEYYSGDESIGTVFQRSSTGTSTFDQFLVTICGLAHNVGVKIPMCPGNDITIVPEYSQNPDWDYVTLDEMDDYTEVPSQG